jgi:hypothetical protein
MLNRRKFLTLASVSALATLNSAGGSAAGPVRLVLVHGRGQDQQNPEGIKTEWINALRRGAQALGKILPDRLDVAFPYYGETLDRFASQAQIPLTSDIRARGEPAQDEFLAFQAEVAEALRQRAGITDTQVDAEYGPNPKPRGPLNWEWVQALLRAIDKNAGGLSQRALETFTRDVFLYTTRAGVRDEIDRIVAAALTDQPTVVVSHSLGSIVMYSVLRSERRSLRIPLFVTIGSPLGIRPIRDQFRPLRFPKPPVDIWYNAFDKRDVVALYPLDASNFPVAPEIENYSKVNNHTDNRHGVAGYLDDGSIAGRILSALGA